jgi:NifU-like protein involved in Fe-S cluster formation
VADQVAQQHVDDVSVHAEGCGHAMASDAIAMASILVAGLSLS